MLIYKIGDLLDAPEPIIVHGCNDKGKMRSGVAKVIRAKYPLAYDNYMDAFHAEGGLVPGRIIPAWVNYPEDAGKTRLVINAITQDGYGYDGAVYLNYAGLSRAFAQLAENLRTGRYDMANIKGPFVAIPRIGAGLGGGDWDKIVPLIESAMGEYDVVVYDLPT